jgi:prevent-host-death family protein
MPTQVNLYEAKTQLSKLVERASRGEEIIIAKAGKPMARLVASLDVAPAPKPLPFGQNLLGAQILQPDWESDLPAELFTDSSEDALFKPGANR